VQYLASIHEDEMVAVFLRTEIASSRFRGAILAILVGQGLDPRIVEQPNLASGEENAYRRAVLGEWRGYGRDADVFTSFPHDVRWYRALATAQDIADLRYINDDYWIELSGGTRLITDAIARIRLGIEAFHVGNGGFWYLADALCVGAVFPELILVGATGRGAARGAGRALASDSLSLASGVHAGGGAGTGRLCTADVKVNRGPV
jgi:hypothetical protein